MIQKNWQELIKPTKLDVTPGTDASRVGTIVAEPLERGFGQTLGNALRRILLSSLQGSAVTAIQIDGVLHEFSSIPGVREDVTDIILNIKTMGVRMHAEGPKKMTLKATGPGAVTAGHHGLAGVANECGTRAAGCSGRRGRGRAWRRRLAFDLQHHLSGLDRPIKAIDTIAFDHDRRVRDVRSGCLCVGFGRSLFE